MLASCLRSGTELNSIQQGQSLQKRSQPCPEFISMLGVFLEAHANTFEKHQRVKGMKEYSFCEWLLN